jgi:hypothetical protein
VDNGQYPSLHSTTLPFFPRLQYLQESVARATLSMPMVVEEGEEEESWCREPGVLPSHDECGVSIAFTPQLLFFLPPLHYLQESVVRTPLSLVVV